MDRSLVVLLVEDNAADRRLTTDVLAETGLTIKLVCLETGEDALAYARREGRYADAPRPHLIILDLGLPGMHGRELLTSLKADPDLRRVPVLVLTSDVDERTEVEAVGLGALEFATKPLDRARLMAVIEYVTEFA